MTGVGSGLREVMFETLGWIREAGIGSRAAAVRTDGACILGVSCGLCEARLKTLGWIKEAGCSPSGAAVKPGATA